MPARGTTTSLIAFVAPPAPPLQSIAFRPPGNWSLAAHESARCAARSASNADKETLMQRFVFPPARALPGGVSQDRPTGFHGARLSGIPLGVLLAMGAGLGAIFHTENAAAADTVLVFTVNTTADPDAYVPRRNGTCGDGVCSLRAAIEEANSLSQDRSYYFNIYIPPGTYKLNRQLVVKGSPSGTKLFIRGAGPDQTMLDGQGRTRVLDIAANALVSLRAVMIQNGRAGKSDDAVLGSHYHGGGIHNHGTLLLENSSLSGNYAPGGQTPSGACTEACGGGLYNAGTAGLINVTVTDNGADSGGGGIANSGTLDLNHVTIANNLAPNGGGLYNAATATLFGTILASNDGIYPGNNCGWPTTLPPKRPTADPALNMEFAISAADPQSCGVSAGDPGLDRVKNRSGGTIYYRIYAWSPAIDRVPFSGLCPVFDQRGILRPQDGNGDHQARCDLGSYERRPKKDP
jgi:CSLREA domain-containing protein